MNACITAGLGCLLIAGSLGAQGDTTQKPPKALDPLVIREKALRAAAYGAVSTETATKTALPLRDTPQSVTTVTRALMVDQRMQSMADVVRYVPGITMGQGEGHRDAPTIRGNSSTADFFVDGVRDDAQYFRDLYNADRVESLRGSNAMIFGRGGGGGIINRVSKTAGWAPARDISLELGSYDHKRATFDVGDGFGAIAAARLNGMYQNSGMFRHGVRLRRYGISPTTTVLLGSNTTFALGYEYLNDHRTVDRGIPSFQGVPSRANRASFFGNPDSSYSDVSVHAASGVLQHQTAGGLTLRNRTRFTQYDKFYQNVFPGAVDSAAKQVSLSGYNNATVRGNLFNQIEASFKTRTGPVGHTLLIGNEVGRQVTDNLRRTGYFNGTSATATADFDRPTITTTVAFRPSAADADNHTVGTVAALFVQDQIGLSRQWQAVVGVRAERFELAVHNNRDSSDHRRDDRMISPRVGLVFKPVEPVSIYSSYSVSHLPSSGDQFASLNATTETLKPERFINYEVGAKWDVGTRVAITGAAYRLDRTNSSAKDPYDPARTVQTGAQRTMGTEVTASGSINGSWQIASAYTVQRAQIVSTTAAATAGASAALVPRMTVSIWNKYRIQRAVSLGLGVIHQSRMYAAVDNKVTLPGFTRLDGAVYLGAVAGVRPQINIENLMNSKYFITANGNNNITPGGPRSIRLSVSRGR